MMSAVIEVVAATVMMLAVMGTAQAQPPLPSHFSWEGPAGQIDLYLHKHGHSVVDVSTGTSWHGRYEPVADVVPGICAEPIGGLGQIVRAPRRTDRFHGEQLVPARVVADAQAATLASSGIKIKRMPAVRAGEQLHRIFRD